ncbi:Mitochondrial fission factor [Caenorhabditis elegans]|uniref:Mitochondrial fission factor n=1 Tax=Caenorhabditis elegans TaxID=6239 RepID=G1K0W6_CAEEL|nr:Mitochondrial fission factor [Caenorhabditis elegans]CCC42165.1 Mitochondrial fission factor [Caenorhabditis elegans]|eukprot:NP_001257209.1 Uncharacterized protein CELE_F11C1.7 [Caenorhabditis elegans]
MYMPEHISGTGDAMSMTGMENFSNPATNPTDDQRKIEAGHDHFFIPEEAVGSIYESADYMAIMDKFADHFHSDVEAHCETDPVRQIKTVRTQLRDITHTLDKLLEDNAKRDRREQFIWAGLAGLALVTLISLLRK